MHYFMSVPLCQCHAKCYDHASTFRFLNSLNSDLGLQEDGNAFSEVLNFFCAVEVSPQVTAGYSHSVCTKCVQYGSLEV